MNHSTKGKDGCACLHPPEVGLLLSELSIIVIIKHFAILPYCASRQDEKQEKIKNIREEDLLDDCILVVLPHEVDEDPDGLLRQNLLIG